MFIITMELTVILITITTLWIADMPVARRNSFSVDLLKRGYLVTCGA